MDALKEIQAWCELWLKGETDRRHTEQFVLGILNTAKLGQKDISERRVR